jgi:regulatory protein
MTEQHSALTSQQVYNAAIRMLARRDHSTTELRQKLRTKFGRAVDEVGEEVIARVREHGYLDDQRFAQSYARSRASRGYGPQYIQRDLAQKGIDSDGIEAALTPFVEEWPQIAQGLVERRYADATHDLGVWEKAARFLQRRGFNSGTVMQALGERPRHDQMA